MGRASESDLVTLAERESKILNEEKIQRRIDSGWNLGKIQWAKWSKGSLRKKNKNYRKELALALLLLTTAARSLSVIHGFISITTCFRESHLVVRWN